MIQPCLLRRREFVSKQPVDSDFGSRADVHAGLPPGSPGYGVFAMIDALEAGIAALPPKDQRTGTDYAKLAGFAEDSPILDTFKLVDKIRVQAAS